VVLLKESSLKDHHFRKENFYDPPSTILSLVQTNLKVAKTVDSDAALHKNFTSLHLIK